MSENVYGNISTVGTWDMDRCTKEKHTPQHTVKIRSSRAAAVCLLLLCVLLLTAVIILCVHIHTKNTHLTDRDLLLTNLTEERDLLLTKYMNILNKTEGWFHSNFGFYFISSLKKNWIESRRYCTERGADLIVIKNREKQDFVTNISNKREFWIGVTDIEEEGRWKWVDGTSVTTGFWASSEEIKEPNGGRRENCAVTYLKKHPKLIGWIDFDCNSYYQYICEKSIWP